MNQVLVRGPCPRGFQMLKLGLTSIKIKFDSSFILCSQMKSPNSMIYIYILNQNIIKNHSNKLNINQN